MATNRFYLTLIMLCAVPAVAQQLTIGAKSVDIKPVEIVPSIDGVVNAREWSGATRIEDLHQVDPIEYSPPSSNTTWYVGYNQYALYVAAHAKDEDPSKVVAKVLKQGASIRNDDRLGVIIDPFNNKRSGYNFALNPNGVRYDAIFTNGTRQSSDWEGIWRGAARKLPDGWSMEMAIPFNTLTFDPNQDTWGMNFWREIPRKDEVLAWNSRNGVFGPTVSGEVRGFENLSQGIGLDVTPALSSTFVRDHPVSDATTDLRPSVDINYKLTPAISALLTINTDFAATEVDGRQLGLERFSLFFPEKRSFFLTDFDIFQFGGVPTSTRGNVGIGNLSGTNGLAFFSRRIGLSASRQPVDIIAGSKVSGRLGNYDFGLLLIRQDEFLDVDESDLLVTRLSRGVLEESTVGLIYTNGNPGSNDNSALGGIDFIYRNTRIGNNRSVEGQFWVQKSDNPGIEQDDLAYSAMISFPAEQGIGFGAQYQNIEKNFDPALGFSNRTGVKLYGAEIGYVKTLSNHPILRDIEQNLEFKRWEYLDSGFVQTQELTWEFLRLRNRSGDFLGAKFVAAKEGLLVGEQPLKRLGILIPEGEYAFKRGEFSLRTAGHRAVSYELGLKGGDFFNGKRRNVSTAIEWRPNKHINFSVDFQYSEYDFPNLRATTRQLKFENEIAFNARWSLTSLIQYDNVSDNIGINSRLHYNPSAGQDIWLVLNHNLVEDEEGDFIDTQTSGAVKFQYTFRF